MTSFNVEYLSNLAQEGKQALDANLRSELNCDGQAWRLEFTTPSLGLNVYSSVAIGSSLRRFKGECIIRDFSPKQVYAVVSNDAGRTTWDRNVSIVESTTISEDENHRLFVIHCGTKQIGPIAARDFVDCILCLYKEDGSIECGGVGLSDAELTGNCQSIYEVLPNHIRAFNHKGSGWTFEHDGSGGTKATMFIHVDLKGWFLPVIINKAVGGSFTSFFQDLRGALRNVGASTEATS